MTGQTTTTQRSPGRRKARSRPAVARAGLRTGAHRAQEGRRATPGRVVRLGQVIQVRGEDVRGELYLLSYAQTASGPQFSLFARACCQLGPPWPRRPGPVMPPAARPGTALIQPSRGAEADPGWAATSCKKDSPLGGCEGVHVDERLEVGLAGRGVGGGDGATVGGADQDDGPGDGAEVIG